MKKETDMILMRIFISENDKHDGKVLYHQIVDLLHEEKIAGATVLRGIAGFGAKSHMHTSGLLTLAQSLPVVIEVIDSQENTDKILPKIEQFIDDGLITLEKVKAIRYSKDNG